MDATTTIGGTGERTHMDLKAQRVAGHYIFGGKRVPSVTFIIGKVVPKDAVEDWKRRTADWETIMNRARFFGKLMHLNFLQDWSEAPLEIDEELLVSDWPPNTRAEITKRKKQWKKLNIEVGSPNFIEHTIHVGGEKPFAGTVDRWGATMVYGESLGNIVMDLKSSSKPQSSHRIQLGAYMLGLKREGLKCDGGLIPYIRNNSAELVFLEKDELEDEANQFLNVLDKYYAMKKRKS